MDTGDNNLKDNDVAVWYRMVVWEIFGIVFGELNDIKYER